MFIFLSAVLLLCGSAALVSAAAISLPVTGQTKCYDTLGTEITCAGTGQDGDKKIGVAWPNPRFTVSGDCVTDNLTGLIWAKNAYLPISAMSWQQALDYVKSLNVSGRLCGQADWRLPQILELESLVHAGYDNETCGASKCGNNAAWLNTQGFINVLSFWYWSSSTVAGSTSVAWNVEMYHGDVNYTGDKTNAFVVWPVRGGQSTAPAGVWKTGQTKCYDTSGKAIACAGTGQDGDTQKGVAWPTPRFTDNSNGTITDNLTGLIWLKNANCFSAKSWPDALTAANALANSQCGLSDGSKALDWRLPNKKELLSLVDFSLYNPALPANYPFTNVQSNWYWSSSAYTGGTNMDWYVNILDGYVSSVNKSGTSYYVWPVRGGQSGSGGTLTLSSTSQTFTSTAGTSSITVTGTGAWTATSTLSWVTITSGASGTGNGTVTISVSANTTGATRTGNITIAGQTVVITQNAASGSAVSLVTTTAQTSYSTIQAAYNANTAATGSTIKVQGTTLTETLVFNQNNSITLAGGYDSTFSTVGATMTTVQGSLTISGGTVTISNIVIQ